MNKLIKIFFILSILTFAYSCAKPKVVNVILPGDKELSCEQLENSIAESQKLKSDAEYAKDGTGGNVARFILFWPAWAQTLHNADVAIVAAAVSSRNIICNAPRSSPPASSRGAPTARSVTPSPSKSPMFATEYPK